jgi:hypothetical protein
MAPKPTKPKITPEQVMKQLHWTRVLKTPAKKTIWDDVEEVKIDPSMVVAKFAAKVIEKKEARQGEEAGAGKPVKEKALVVLDPKRSSAIGIMLSRLPAPVVLCEGIRTLDAGKVDREQLESVIANLPTLDEMKAVQDAAGPHVTLDKPEKYVLMLSTIERVGPRLRSWAFKLDYDAQMDSLVADVAAVDRACSELMKSPNLKRVLGTVLAFGNYMNGGTAKGQADGFNIDFLTKLTDTKDLEGRMTLLDQIVEFLSTKHPETLTLPEELAGCKAAAKITLERLEGDISKMAQRLKSTKALSDNVMQVVAAGDPFPKVIPPFLESAESQVTALQEKFGKARESFFSTVVFFGVPEGKAKTTKTEEYFSIFRNFLAQFEAALPKKPANQAAAAAAAAALAARARSGSNSGNKADKRRSIHPQGNKGPGGKDAMSALVDALKAGQGGIGPGMLKKRAPAPDAAAAAAPPP